MERQGITIIISNLIKTLQRSGKKAGADFDMKSIHQFRVTYKRLRAFLRMPGDGTLLNRKIKMSRKIKAAYMAAGRIRDLQLHQEHITGTAEKSNRIPPVKLYADETIKAKRLFAKTYTEINFSKAKNEIVASIPGKFSPASFKLFIRKKWEAVKTIVVSENFSDTNLHRVRKNLKDLFYNLELFKGSEYKIMCRLACKNKRISYFKKLLKELGNFQDKCVAIGLSEVYHKKPHHPTRNKWEVEKERNKKKIIASLKAIHI